MAEKAFVARRNQRLLEHTKVNQHNAMDVVAALPKIVALSRVSYSTLLLNSQHPELERDFNGCKINPQTMNRE